MFAFAITAVLLPAAARAHSSEHSAHGAHAPARASTPAQQPWGIAAAPASATRTVEVAMGDDMRFVPDRLAVREGETVRFVVRNRGRLMHEMVIGTTAALRDHAAQMAAQPGMAHEAPWMSHVAPGARGEIVWRFNRPGQFAFACLVAGHYQAGMAGTIDVVPAAARKEAP
jgi:uncharacterized cupredoxin-like copper-binding protein